MTVEVVPPFGGCVWPVDTACFTAEWDAFSAGVQARAKALASATLERLTGYRVGACPITVRPCKPSCASAASPYVSAFGNTAFQPQINPLGQWINSCGCQQDCSCTSLCELKLPGPVGRVDEVRLDGVSMADTLYRVDNGNLLVYIGTDDCPWPSCQDMALPDTAVGTLSITYLNAYPVDSLGAYAMGVLSMEYGRACAGNNCRLPAGVTMIVRQGISMEVVSGAFPSGMTGIREVDTFLALWNPDGLSRQATVWSPGQHRPRVTTIPGGIAP